MDEKKRERINNFLCAWGYKPEQLAQYLKTTAPNLAPSTEKGQQKTDRAWWSEFLGHTKPEPKSTPIPRPEDTAKRCIESDIFVLLGMGENALTLEDLSGYLEQRELGINARNTQEAEEKRMFMSKMLHALNASEDRQRHAEASAIIEKHVEHNSRPPVDMNAFIRNAPGDCDSTPRTIIMKNNDNSGSTFNAQLRGLDPDNRI